MNIAVGIRSQVHHLAMFPHEHLPIRDSPVMGCIFHLPRSSRLQSLKTLYRLLKRRIHHPRNPLSSQRASTHCLTILRNRARQTSPLNKHLSRPKKPPLPTSGTRYNKKSASSNKASLSRQINSPNERSKLKPVSAASMSASGMSRSERTI